jgi:hypothetical protein
MISLLSITLSAPLFILLYRSLPIQDGIGSSAFHLYLIVMILAKAWLDGTEESGCGVLLFAWITGNLIWILLYRVGFGDLQSRVGVSHRVAVYCAIGSQGSFLVCMYFFISWKAVVNHRSSKPKHCAWESAARPYGKGCIIPSSSAARKLQARLDLSFTKNVQFSLGVPRPFDSPYYYWIPS